MKKAFVLSASVLLMAATSLAQETKSTPATQEKNVVTEVTKKPRAKKAQMCAECGKPESECECHGHKKEDADHKHKH